MKVFDYIYYRIYWIYQYKWKESMPNLYSIGAISVLQMINISSVIFLAVFLFNPDFHINKYFGVIFIFGFWLLNHLRYKNNRSFYNLEKQWNNEPRNIRIKRGILVFLYILLSWVVILTILIYRKNIENFGYVFVAFPEKILLLK